MKILKPADVIPVTGEMIASSIDKLIIATMDYDLNAYPPLWEILQNQKSAGVKIFFYSGNTFNNRRLSSTLSFKDPLIIRNLNFNLVMNDHQALISTQHFGAPVNGTLEVSLLSETQEEYQEIFAYYVELLHENASQPSSYYLLSENILKESVLLKELVNNKGYKEITMIKKYYPLSTFISELGYIHQDVKIGNWLYFNDDGMLQKSVNFDQSHGNEEIINWDEKNTKRQLLYSFVNMIGGIYQVPIGKVNPQTELDALIGNRNRNELFSRIQQLLKIKFPPCAIHSMGELIEICYQQLEKRKGKNVLQKLLHKN